MDSLEKDTLIDTVYIGGGTPSYINEKYIYDILKIRQIQSRLKSNAEITIEINPGTINENKLKCYKQAGINRISIGLQSTDDKILKTIGRIHTYSEFLDGYNMARNLDFNNINVDLMLALPGQDTEMLQNSVKKVIELQPEHISIYSLILEEDTELMNMVKSGRVKLPDENQEREMYWETKRILENNNYNHYEISNFSKEGYESKHNMNCWEQKEYLGCGIAAHSYYDNKRFSNTIKLEEYINNIKNKQVEKNITVNEIQSKEDKEKEYVLLGMRKINGVNLNKFEEKFDCRLETIFEKELNELSKQNLIKIDNNYLSLSEKGIDFANIVWEKFV